MQCHIQHIAGHTVCSTSSDLQLCQINGVARTSPVLWVRFLVCVLRRRLRWHADHSPNAMARLNQQRAPERQPPISMPTDHGNGNHRAITCANQSAHHIPTGLPTCDGCGWTSGQTQHAPISVSATTIVLTSATPYFRRAINTYQPPAQKLGAHGGQIRAPFHDSKSNGQHSINCNLGRG